MVWGRDAGEGIGEGQLKCSVGSDKACTVVQVGGRLCCRCGEGTAVGGGHVQAAHVPDLQGARK